MFTTVLVLTIIYKQQPVPLTLHKRRQGTKHTAYTSRKGCELGPKPLACTPPRAAIA